MSVLSATYNGPQPKGQQDLLMIEQQEWPKSGSYLSRGNMMRFIGNFMYNRGRGNIEVNEQSWMPERDEFTIGSPLSPTIYVYPFFQDLNYQLRASYGTIGERTVHESVRRELVNFSLDERVQPDYPAVSIVSAAWLNDVWDVNGSIISPPEITIDDTDLVVPQKVYGAAEVHYNVRRHIYTLSIPKREAAQENHYTSVVYAVYDGGVKWVVVDLPEGIDDEDGSNPNDWGSSGSISRTDDDGNVPTAASADRDIVKDYCSQEIISDDTYENIGY